MASSSGMRNFEYFFLLSDVGRFKLTTIQLTIT